MLRPASVQEVSALLKYCNDRRLAVCPQGGNTGEAGLSTLFLIAPNALTQTQFLYNIIAIFRQCNFPPKLQNFSLNMVLALID